MRTSSSLPSWKTWKKPCRVDATCVSARTSEGHRPNLAPSLPPMEAIMPKGASPKREREFKKWLRDLGERERCGVRRRIVVLTSRL